MWDAEGGGGLPIRRHSYRGYRVELWRIADRPKNDKIQLKVASRVDDSGVLGLHPAKTGTTRVRPMAGLVECVFYLV